MSKDITNGEKYFLSITDYLLLQMSNTKGYHYGMVCGYGTKLLTNILNGGRIYEITLCIRTDLGCVLQLFMEFKGDDFNLFTVTTSYIYLQKKIYEDLMFINGCFEELIFIWVDEFVLS